MYHDHFGFYTAPFSLSTHLHFVFNSGVFEETMAHLVYGLDGGEDIILITGEIGTGKTLALNNLTEHVSSRYAVSLINVTQIDFRELLKLVLVDLNIQVPPGADRADLLTALKTELVALQRQRRRLLLIVDEAQNLDLATLEGIRLLTNLGPVNEQVIQVVLSGQPALRAKIDMPELAQVRQRIRVHYHLDTLTAEEVGQYIDHRVRMAGCDRQIFRKDAIQSIHKLSGGIPRLINILADKALLSAYVDGKHEVSAEHIEENESLVRSPVEESQLAARAAQSSESAPPRVLEKETAAKAALPPEPEFDDADDEDEPMAVGRPNRLRRLLLTVASPLLLLVLAGVVFWPYLKDVLPEGLVNPRGAALVPAAIDSTIARPDTVLVDAVAMPDSTALDAVTDSLIVAEVVPDSTEAAPPVTMPVDTAAVVQQEATERQDLLPDFAENALAGPVVHVGSFRDSLRAEVMAEKFREQEYPVHVRLTVVDSSEWYRVYVGPWPTIEAALDIQSEITQSGLAAWSMVTRIRK